MSIVKLYGSRNKLQLQAKPTARAQLNSVDVIAMNIISNKMAYSSKHKREIT